jgi:hypothetical protein
MAPPKVFPIPALEPVTITVPAKARRHAAEAMIDRALSLEARWAEMRPGSPGRAALEARARELRGLAAALV